jgi:hypothetical protein
LPFFSIGIVCPLLKNALIGLSARTILCPLAFYQVHMLAGRTHCIIISV